LHVNQKSGNRYLSRVVVIGAYGHIGTYLVPRLVEAGHEVIAVSRGQAKPYVPHAAWTKVTPKIMDRVALEKTRQFGPALAALKADIVIDLICFTMDSARQLVAALHGRVSHLLHIGRSGPMAIQPWFPRQNTRPNFRSVTMESRKN
jgi:nucleoside-diphosphate-sugar epimerase